MIGSKVYAGKLEKNRLRNKNCKVKFINEKLLWLMMGNPLTIKNVDIISYQKPDA